VWVTTATTTAPKEEPESEAINVVPRDIMNGRQHAVLPANVKLSASAAPQTPPPIFHHRLQPISAPVTQNAKHPMAPRRASDYLAVNPFALMHLVLAVLAVLFVIAGFVGFIGGVFTLIFWALAVLCLIGAWKLRPRRQRTREDRHLPPDPDSPTR